MRLTKLELHGFKSFPQKTELRFQGGVTAIVGPNGSGKSNISDAVRWVLGEQSAKALRGSRMEDIIFNGTEQRKPQSFCEVSLTFDNADGELPIDFSEVMVTRRVYRSGESEYLINQNASRLRDVQALFRDTGIGKEGYSIISQGRVEEILSNKSGDRRSAFEEAAGVMKYRVRKEEAERKLDNTRKNLTRLADILDELCAQVGPLEEKSQTARTFLRLREELREIEVNVFLYQHDRLNERVRTLTESLAQFSERITADEAAEKLLASSCADAEERERTLNATITELQNQLITFSANAEASSGEAKVIQERMVNAVSERRRLEEEIRQCEAKNGEISSRIQSVSGEAGTLAADKDTYEAGVASLLGEMKALESAISDKDAQLEAQKDSLIEAMNRLSDAKIQISRLETMQGTLHTRLSAIGEEESVLEVEGEKLGGEYAEAEGVYGGILEGNAKLEAEREGLIRQTNEINLLLSRARQAALDMEREASSAKSRLSVLTEMKNAHEGYYASVRNLLRDADQSGALKKCIEGVVAELISVPEKYEAAIEMALGSVLQNIVTPTEQDAKFAIEHLRAKRYGRATFLPVSVIRPRLLSRDERALCDVKGFVGVASELVSYDQRYQGIFENLLGRTVIVESLDAGIEINRRARAVFRIATLEGDIINQGGSMTGGSAQKREFSLIGRTREIEQVGERVKRIAAELEEKQRQSAGFEAQLLQTGTQLNTLSARIREQEAQAAAQHEKLEIIQRYVEENASKLERLRLERAQLGDNIENLDLQRQEAQAAETNLQSGNVATQDDIRAAQAELYALREKLAKQNESFTAQKVKLTSAERELYALNAERLRLEREQNSVLGTVAQHRAQIESSLERHKEFEGKATSLDVNIDEIRKQIDQLTDQIHHLDEERSGVVDALTQMRQRREELSSTVNAAQEQAHRAELNVSRAQMELSNMQDRIWNEYELTYENALPFRREIAVTSSHIRIDELRTEIRALGDVSVSAIEDYQTLKERYDGLSRQCEDLTKAEADLNELIEDLLHTMENEFRKQFVQIQQNFTTVFTQLFGGGHAELVLSDKNDILSCDIDIVAQPPGKKLQMLTLLSGGERALTAIALLFAILKLKPTAFCILDEIESSLDEANVSNFAQFVRGYSEDTQFILITHRKGSMEVCDTLYGVVMEERGISRVISARFNEEAV